ncbi:MAG TPA: amidohydrolase family protein [Xanthobacteraceae bacterium]|jgi:aminocarboxymuconate-semialdehyde decarboxylase|nr:amidohydrolase family protein [Xanthobacteraceae bacterium]
MDAKSNEKPAPSSARGPRRKPVVIDFHAHFMTQEVFDATYKLSVLGKLRASAENTGAVRSFPDALIQPMTDLGVRLRAMDKMGVDIQVVSPNILHQCTYALDAEEGLRLERLNNDHVADMVAKAPDRLIGIGSVPLQDTASAIAEMDRLVGDLKLKGVIVASRVNDMELGDARLRPFWKKAEALDIPVFVHPAGNPDPRLQRHSMLISLGQPLEEAFAQTSLIYDGVLDECPNLKIAFAHGGGFIPYYAGRFDWMYRRGSTSQMKADFSTYLRSFYYETVLFNPDILEHLAEKVDASHIMLGSDFPFGEADPVAFLQSARQISEASREAILGANAARFLAIKI